MIVELNEQNFDENAAHGLKLVEFYTTWCIYCKNMASKDSRLLYF